MIIFQLVTIPFFLFSGLPKKEKEKEKEKEKFGGSGQGHNPDLVLEVMRDLKALKISKEEEEEEEGGKGKEREKKLNKRENRELGGHVCVGLNGIEEGLRLVARIVEEREIGKVGSAAVQRMEQCLNGLVEVSFWLFSSIFFLVFWGLFFFI